MRTIKFLLLTYFIVCLSFYGRAQTEDNPTLEYYLPKGVTYDPKIPTPKDVLGYNIGEWHISHDQLLKYVEKIAEVSDKVTIEQQGRTYENRPTMLLTITAPENHQNIEKIRTDHVALTDPNKSSGLNTENMPVVVWLGYSIHGNEPSGANAAPLVLYYLAAAQSDEVVNMLKNTVVLLDPSFNPDGLHRFSTWVNSHKNYHKVSDPNDREYTEAWPRGRTNHYWFDLNRDWLLVQHPESQGRIANFQKWKPNILTDHHEMGTNSTFFFQPGIPSRKNPLTPEMNVRLTEKIGEFHAKALDNIGSSYYSEESFDDFYYGKGSSYPDAQGAVGILFEQASSRGHRQESANGLLTFPFTIRNQFTTSLSTLEAANSLRKEMLDYQRSFYKDAIADAQKDNLKAYVFGSETDEARNYHFLDLLRRHKVEVYELNSDVSAGGNQFKKGQGYVVPLNQPQYRLIKGMFYRQTIFQDSLFYDVSSWTLPLAFGLPNGELNGRAFSTSILGDKVETIAMPKKEVVGGKSKIGYVFRWNGYYAPRALYRLQKEGVITKVASKDFSYTIAGENQTFTYGSIVVPTGLQEDISSDELYNLVQKIASEDGITVYALSTGLANGVDIGSPSINRLRTPKVALMVGNGASSYEAGEMWHLLDQRYHIPVVKIEVADVSYIDLDRYNVLLMPNGSYGSITERGKENIKRWVQSGGTIVAVKNAVKWLSGSKFTKLEYESNSATDSTHTFEYARLQANRGSQRIGGAIFETRLDTSHPLGYGFINSNIPVFRNSEIFIKKSKNAYANPLVYTESPLLSGYISKRNLEKLKGTAAITVSGVGRGRIISMVDNPNFRAFWYGTNKLFANAIFFGDLISGAATD